jgi:FixJ family two-component response regulator
VGLHNIGVIMAEQTRESAASSTTSNTVVVVDGDEGVREGLRVLLETLKLHVETYRSAEEFLRNIDDQWPGCLISEIQLPGIGGVDLLSWLQERGIDVPVIILATQADEPTVARAMLLGAVDVIEKPFVAEAMVARIREVLGLPVPRVSSDDG